MIGEVGEGAAHTPRGYIGLSVRCGIDFIAERGLTSLVRADATPTTRRSMDNPPAQFGWQDATVLDELESLLQRHGGREACVDLGHYAGITLGGGIVQPVLAFAMQVFGARPTTIFHNLDRFYSIVTRGLHYRYEPCAATSGALVLTADGPAPPPALFDVCRGNLLYLLELTGTHGFVDQPETRSADAWRTIVSYAVRWD